MISRKLWRRIVFFAWIALLAPRAIAALAQAAQEASEIVIRAASKKYEKDRIIAVGNVEVEYRDLKLFADRVEIDTKTKDAFAVGVDRDVTLQLPDETITFKSVVLNLETRLGKFDRAVGLLQPSIRYESATIERKEDNLYSLGRTQFTSCAQPVPRWQFSCARANFKKGDYMEMWGAVFSIKKIPIFYLPYMRYPLDRERATGFLMPQLGFSGVKGVTYAQDFYWAIARNMDATFSLDYYSKRGAGAGAEYRYVFSGGTGGSLNLFYFLFKKGEGPIGATPSGSPAAYLIRWSHNQPLPLGFNLIADVDYQSSYQFLREFDNNFQRATVSNRRSQIYLSKSWSGLSLNVRASRFETNFPGTDGGNSIITYYLPQITLNSFKMKLVNPVYFSFAGSFNRWEYGWQADYDADRQMHAQTLSMNPVISVPFAGIPWLTMNAAVSANLNYYWQSYKIPAGGGGRAIVDEPIFARNFGLSLEFIGPVFYKIYDIGRGGRKVRESTSEPKKDAAGPAAEPANPGDGLAQEPQSQSGQEAEGVRVKHIIEPSITYQYESPVADRDRIIAPYGFFRYHQLSYGITNQVLIKQEKMPKPVFTWVLRQVYYISAEDSPNSLYLVEGKVPRFSEINSYLRFYPAGKYSVDFTANFNPYYKTLSSVRLGAQIGGEADPAFLHVSWFKSINSWMQSNQDYLYSLYNRHQVNFFGGVKIPSWSLEAVGEVDFNIAEKKMLYTAATVSYHYQCLDLKAEIRVYYFREKPETQFRVSFGLGNIGKTTDFLGGMGF